MQLEQRYSFSGEEEQGQETIGTLKISWRDEWEAGSSTEADSPASSHAHVLALVVQAAVPLPGSRLAV